MGFLLFALPAPQPAVATCKGPEERPCTSNRQTPLLAVLHTESGYRRRMITDSIRSAIWTRRSASPRASVRCIATGPAISSLRRRGRKGRCHAAHASGTGAKATGHPDDSGLFAASARAQRAEFGQLAGTAAAGVALAGDHHGGSGERIPNLLTLSRHCPSGNSPRSDRVTCLTGRKGTLKR
jgi:hypothetical protein